jgi:hypothetical protein
MDTKKVQNKWLINAGLFAGFMILFCLDLTGVALPAQLQLPGSLSALYGCERERALRIRRVCVKYCNLGG